MSISLVVFTTENSVKESVEHVLESNGLSFEVRQSTFGVFLFSSGIEQLPHALHETLVGKNTKAEVYSEDKKNSSFIFSFNKKKKDFEFVEKYSETLIKKFEAIPL